MVDSESGLVIHEDGRTVFVGFPDQSAPPHFNAQSCRRFLTTLVEENDAHVLKFDLTGIHLAPSGLLAVLRALEQRGVDVRLINPSAAMRDILAISRPDQHLGVEETDAAASTDSESSDR